LVIDVEEKFTGEMWHGDFSAKYVEEITHKTGVYKKFNVFVKMLVSAVKSHSGDQNVEANNLVQLSLLSQQDVMALKSSQAKSEQSSQTATKKDKKYMIMTYEGEFEKVHYPLPLAYLEEPEMD